MMLAIKFTWPQPVNINTKPQNTTAVRLPLGVMIKNPTGSGSGGDAETLQGRNSAYHLDRTNHTGTQAQSTVTGLVTKLAALDQTDIDQQAQIDLKLDAADYNDRYKGLFTSYYELELAWPTASAGDKAQVDWGLGTDVVEYAWDVSDQYWAAIGIASVSSTDQLPEGSSNLYHTGQRVRDTALSGLSLLSSLAINAADSVLGAFGKLQAQISALAMVARTGSYNDLSDKPVITQRDGFDYFAFLGDRWLPKETVNSLAYPISPWAPLHNTAIVPATHNTLLTYVLLEFDLCVFPTAVSDGNLVVIINGVIANSTISSGFSNTNYFARMQLQLFRRAGGSFGYLVRSQITGAPLFRGSFSPATPIPLGVDITVELRFRPSNPATSVDHISVTNCTLAVKQVQDGVL